ncbi:energy-coupling factor transporter transmembrane component T family protein [Paenibacillus selenitireducens]|nr:energy-coupling factor transporter transmembrane component T [Paenibacillus selenitireducens]
MDPLSKLIGVICMTVLALTYQSALVQGVILGIVILCGLIYGKRTVRILGRVTRYLLLFGIPFFFVQLLWVPGDTTILQLGPVHLTLEALDYAAAITCRLFTLFLTSVIYLATTDPRDVVLMLTQQLRVPYRFAYAVSLSLRFLPILTEETEIIRSTHQLRGMRPPKGVSERIQAWKIFSIAIFVNSVRRMQMIASAMDAKGFGAYSSRTYMKTIKTTWFSLIMIVAFIGSTFIVLYYV